MSSKATLSFSHRFFNVLDQSLSRLRHCFEAMFRLFLFASLVSAGTDDFFDCSADEGITNPAVSIIFVDDSQQGTVATGANFSIDTDIQNIGRQPLTGMTSKQTFSSTAPKSLFNPHGGDIRDMDWARDEKWRQATWTQVGNVFEADVCTEKVMYVDVSGHKYQKVACPLQADWTVRVDANGFAFSYPYGRWYRSHTVFSDVQGNKIGCVDYFFRSCVHEDCEPTPPATSLVV